MTAWVNLLMRSAKEGKHAATAGKAAANFVLSSPCCPPIWGRGGGRGGPNRRPPPRPPGPLPECALLLSLKRGGGEKRVPRGGKKEKDGELELKHDQTLILAAWSSHPPAMDAAIPWRKTPSSRSPRGQKEKRGKKRTAPIPPFPESSWGRGNPHKAKGKKGKEKKRDVPAGPGKEEEKCCTGTGRPWARSFSDAFAEKQPEVAPAAALRLITLDPDPRFCWGGGRKKKRKGRHGSKHAGRQAPAGGGNSRSHPGQLRPGRKKGKEKRGE